MARVLPGLAWLGLVSLLTAGQGGVAPTPVPARALDPAYLEVSADVEIEYRSSGPNSARQRIPIVCVSGPRSWSIEDYGSSLNGFSRWFYDGTNVFQSLRVTRPMSASKISPLLPAAAPAEVARSNLTIHIWPSPGGHPMGDPAVNLAWLAFCSGPYLRLADRLVPLPCDILQHTPDRFAYQDRTEVFPDAFGSPRLLDLFLSTNLYLASIEGFYEGWGERYLPGMRAAAARLQPDRLTFQYRVTSMTNCFGRILPLRFEFSQEARDYIQAGNDARRGVGTVKSIRPVTGPEGVFDSRLQQTVVDWRFRHGNAHDGLLYRWDRDELPTTEDPVVQSGLRRRSQTSPANPP